MMNGVTGYNYVPQTHVAKANATSVEEQTKVEVQNQDTAEDGNKKGKIAAALGALAATAIAVIALKHGKHPVKPLPLPPAAKAIPLPASMPKLCLPA